jgi:hypothetical protein
MSAGGEGKTLRWCAGSQVKATLGLLLFAGVYVAVVTAGEAMYQYKYGPPKDLYDLGKTLGLVRRRDAGNNEVGVVFGLDLQLKPPKGLYFNPLFCFSGDSQ